VLVRDRNGELVEQVAHGGVHRRCVREFREHDQPHREERRAPGDSRVDHREHAIRVLAHVRAIRGIAQIRLAGGRAVSDDLGHVTLCR
jgi:hypothetical protein